MPPAISSIFVNSGSSISLPAMRMRARYHGFGSGLRSRSSCSVSRRYGRMRSFGHVSVHSWMTWNSYPVMTGLSAMRISFISVMMRHTSLNCSTALRSFSSEKSTP